MTGLAQAYAHCETELRAEDHDSWLAALYAPSASRPALHAIGAFAVELGHVRTRVRQPMAGEIRLQWWRDVVEGERASEAAAHPVAAALVDTMARARLPAALLAGMIDAHRGPLYDEAPADLPALEGRLVAIHGTPVRSASRVLGAGSAADAAADDAGAALGWAALIGDLGRGETGRRVMLPDDLLCRLGCGQADVDRGSPAVRVALVDLARGRLASLRRRRGGIGPAGPAFLTTALIEPRLASAAGRQPLEEISPLRRQWRLWRAARRGGVL